MTGSEPEFEADDDAEEDSEADSSPDRESDPDNSEGEGDEADRGDAEPPTPTDESELESPAERWGVGSRVLALSALLGCAFVVWWQLLRAPKITISPSSNLSIPSLNTSLKS